jgi:hypothetical protein
VGMLGQWDQEPASKEESPRQRGCGWVADRAAICIPARAN